MSAPRAEPALLYSGAAIYAAAAFVGVVETIVPGGPTLNPAPGVLALVISLAIVVWGPTVPRRVVFALGPIGIALIAYALSATKGYSDAAILYSWPTLWVAYFFSASRTAIAVAWTGAAHAVALISMPPGAANFDRWCDVMVSVVIVAAVVRVLVLRNDRLVEELTREARSDPLTGLLNRRGLAEHLDIEIARAVRHCGSLAVIAVDVDHFKTINDTYGHDTGDRVLVQLAATLNQHTRGGDLTARVGGDEFIVVLPDTDLADAQELADRLRWAIQAETKRIQTVPLSRVSISAGVAAGHPPVTADALMSAADEALYLAKEGGRNATEGASTHAHEPGTPRQDRLKRQFGRIGGADRIHRKHRA